MLIRISKEGVFRLFMSVESVYYDSRNNSEHIIQKSTDGIHYNILSFRAGGSAKIQVFDSLVEAENYLNEKRKR